MTGSAETLNSQCFCAAFDAGTLRAALQSELKTPQLVALFSERCPFIYAARPVFVARVHLQRMAQVVSAVEAVVALPAYREAALAQAPDIARHVGLGTKSVFFGYDFHLHGDALGLIEINTNAGGAMLNALLARAQQACCTAMQTPWANAAAADVLEERIVQMFRNEWRLSGRTQALRSIALIDSNPEQQFLYPEFVLFKQLFERHGLQAVIADPSQLQWRAGALWIDELPIDLIYNRLTDFYLVEPTHAVLREAYLKDAVVLTPHPQAHALYANKRNLALLTDAVQLQAWNVPAAIQAMLLNNIPKTEVVQATDADRLWRQRRQLFFKPMAGFGSRAAYRGDKLTRRVWQDILEGSYVAQELIAPGERFMSKGEATSVLKFDLRAYVYEAHVQWITARLYQGQTTNFRTPGGGFAPVYETD